MRSEGTNGGSRARATMATRRAVLGKVADEHRHILVPYRGAERHLDDLRAEQILLTPEDVKAIRRFFGGGAVGRERAKELLDLRCWVCGCRVTHRDGRSPHFAAQFDGQEHGPDCDREASRANGSAHQGDLGSAIRGTHYVVTGARAGAALPAQMPRESPARERASTIGATSVHVDTPLRILVEAIAGNVPPNSTASFHGSQYAIVRADELNTLQDGASVAVFGRLAATTWDRRKGLLALKASGSRFQVWATGHVPAHLLGLPHGATPGSAPEISTLAPFMAFGSLKRGSYVEAVALKHSTMLVMLEPLRLTTSLTTQESRTLEARPILPDVRVRMPESTLEPSRPACVRSVEVNDITLLSHRRALLERVAQSLRKASRWLRRRLGLIL